MEHIGYFFKRIAVTTEIIPHRPQCRHINFIK